MSLATLLIPPSSGGKGTGQKGIFAPFFEDRCIACSPFHIVTMVGLVCPHRVSELLEAPHLHTAQYVCIPLCRLFSLYMLQNAPTTLQPSHPANAHLPACANTLDP